MTPADRTDLIEEYQKRIAVFEEFAPKMMDETEIKAVIDEVLATLGIDTPTAKDKGRIMKELMPKVKGKADGKLVNQIVGVTVEVILILPQKVATGTFSAGVKGVFL